VVCPAPARGDDGRVVDRPEDRTAGPSHIAEWAMPKEYERAYEFLDDLALGLGLGRDRIVLVPGSHDVNRKMCHSYFLNREALDEVAVPPYWPKWARYAALAERFHGRTLPRDEPWGTPSSRS
jgi:hypothetical protein